MKTLNSDDLSNMAQYFRDISLEQMKTKGKLQAELKDLVDNGASANNINAKQQDILETNTRITQNIQEAQRLDAQAIKNILVSTNSVDAISKITDAKNKVLEAIKEIADVRRTLQYVDLFIRIAGAIIGAATTTTPPAQIDATIKAINLLYDADFG